MIPSFPQEAAVRLEVGLCFVGPDPEHRSSMIGGGVTDKSRETFGDGGESGTRRRFIESRCAPNARGWGWASWLGASRKTIAVVATFAFFVGLGFASARTREGLRLAEEGAGRMFSVRFFKEVMRGKKFVMGSSPVYGIRNCTWMVRLVDRLAATVESRVTLSELTRLCTKQDH